MTTPTPPHPGFHLRKARPADLAALLQLEQASFTTDLLSRARMCHWIKADNGILLVACPADNHNEVLAYALAMTRRNSSAIRLYSIATATSVRGQGLGPLLMQAIEEEARRLGYTRLRLEVAEDNTRARSLYDSLGYVRTAYIPGYYENGQNAIRMEKNLE